jgi:phage gpG-like protein
MINIEIQGKLPSLEGFNFTNTMEKVARHLELSIKRNFAEGGRPQEWQIKKDGSPSHLYISGALFNTIGFEFGESYAEAGAMTLLPYSWVHQAGFSGVKKNGVFMNMPARPYVMFQEEDFDFIESQFGDDIVKYWDTHGEVIAV